MKIIENQWKPIDFEPKTIVSRNPQGTSEMPQENEKGPRKQWKGANGATIWECIEIVENHWKLMKTYRFRTENLSIAKTPGNRRKATGKREGIQKVTKRNQGTWKARPARKLLKRIKMGTWKARWQWKEEKRGHGKPEKSKWGHEKPELIKKLQKRQ